MSDRRLQFHDWLVAQLGKPYVWGGRGPDWFDCSGLVVCGLRAVGVPDKCERCGRSLRALHSAHRLWECLEPTDPEHVLPYDLCFYGPSASNVTHVTVYMGDGQGATALERFYSSRILGANGGNQSTTSPAAALRQGAKVGYRPQVRYRPGFRGLRRLPLP